MVVSSVLAAAVARVVAGVGPAVGVGAAGARVHVGRGDLDRVRQAPHLVRVVHEVVVIEPAPGRVAGADGDERGTVVIVGRDLDAGGLVVVGDEQAGHLTPSG